MTALLDALAGAKVYDLAQPYFVGMPHHPAHPPFLYSLVKQHGEYIGPAGHSSASDAIALGNFSCGGRLFGDAEVEAVQSYGGGIQRHPIDGVPPILRRGVLLDIAGA